MMKRSLLAIAVLTLGAVHSGAAQETRRSGDSNARMQAALQQLTGEKTALQTENTRLKEQVSKLEQELKTLKKDQTGLERRASTAESRLTRLQSGQQSSATRADATEARLNEVVGKYRELADTLRTVETEKGGLEARLARESQALKSCSEKNVELAGVANEALDRYEEKGCFTAMVQKEPFTQIGRTRVENAVEESKIRVEALRVPAQAAPVEEIKP